jgi:hypothetical protein
VELKLLMFENVIDSETELYVSKHFDIYSRSTGSIKMVATRLDR